MEAVVGKISAALGVQQERDDDHDEDINLPLKPSKRGARDGAARGTAASPLVGTAMTVCLVTFALLFGAFVAFSATYSTAQAAWSADGFSGLFGPSSTVVADQQQQSADWGKISKARTQGAQGARGARGARATQLTAAQKEIAQLKRELQQAKQHREGGARRAGRGDRNKDGWRDKWGHGDYASEVERKERAEEQSINRKLAKDDTDSEKVEEAGLDKAHVKDLNRQKAAISRQDELARKQGAADYRRRAREVDRLMPDDSNCPGPGCLTTSGPSSDGPSHIRELHRHAPWQKHYPGEMDNVMTSTPWVKVSGMSDFARQVRASLSCFCPALAAGRGEGGGEGGRERALLGSNVHNGGGIFPPVAAPCLGPVPRAARRRPPLLLVAVLPVSLRRCLPLVALALRQRHL